MIPIISILAIIVVFSLYDYFSSKSWNMVTSKTRNDTVFENRNKEYGAYQIRKDYDKRLLLILFGLTFGIGGIWGASHLFRDPILEKKETPKIIPGNIIADLFDDDEVIDLPELTSDQPEQSAGAETQLLTELTVIDDPIMTQQITYVDPNLNSGTVVNPGDGDGDFDTGLLTGGTGGNGGIIDVPDPDVIHEALTEPAEFPGGMSALRKFIADNIDLSTINGSSKISLRFVVDTEGNISAVEVTRNSEACKSCEKAAIAVVKAMPQWKPGKYNGRVVKSYYRLPITIQ